MASQNISTVQVIQINLQHAKDSTSLLSSDLASLHTSLALIQEPYVHNGKVQGFDSLGDYDVLYDSNKSIYANSWAPFIRVYF